MLKKGCLLALVVILLLTVSTACGSTENKAGCKDIADAVVQITGSDSFDTAVCYGEELYEDSFPNLYGVQWSMIDDGAIIYTEAGGKADEVTILHLKQSSDVRIAKDKLQDRVNDRLNQFNGYKPEEAYKLNDATIASQGNYVFLIVASDARSIENEIRRVISAS